MKILHLTTLPYGGAGVACVRLHNALLDAGVESKVLSVMDSPHTIREHYSFEKTDPDFERTLSRVKIKQATDGLKIRMSGRSRELFSFPDALWKTEQHPLIKEADIIHLHWVAGMIDVSRFFAGTSKPIVWTMHDAWPFSGGFHYEGYWDTKSFSAASTKYLEIKKRAYSGREFSIISPSNYLLDLCTQSQVFQNSVFSHIPYSIPSSVFSPNENRNAVREKHGVKPEHFLCVYGSDELDYYRKGADLLLEAFVKWDNPKAKLIVAGKRGKLKVPEDARIQIIERISGEKEMAQFLGAADALIHTSREDNLPNIILEAMFCGTPVLATPAGGVKEMITPFQNGILANEISAAAILEGFNKIAVMQADRQKISMSAREKYADAVQAEKVLNVYRKL